MITIACVKNVSIRRVTIFTPWFDVYVDEKHLVGYPNEAQAFAKMMELVSDGTA